MTEALPFSEAVGRLIELSLAEVRVATPARVIGYNANKRTVDVQPNIDRRQRENGQDVLMPAVSDVPVYFPTADGGAATITWPIKQGDPCLLVVSDRYAHDWLLSGNRSAPSNPRKHDISDAFAYVGFQPFSEASAADPDAVVVQYGDGQLRAESDGTISLQSGATPAQLSKVTVERSGAVKIELSPTGKIAIGNQIAEVVDILSKTLINLSATVVPQAPSGTSPLSTAATFAQLNGLLSQIKGTL